jgi:hypothetical protein
LLGCSAGGRGLRGAPRGEGVPVLASVPGFTHLALVRLFTRRGLPASYTRPRTGWAVPHVCWNLGAARARGRGGWWLELGGPASQGGPPANRLPPVLRRGCRTTGGAEGAKGGHWHVVQSVRGASAAQTGCSTPSWPGNAPRSVGGTEESKGTALWVLRWPKLLCAAPQAFLSGLFSGRQGEHAGTVSVWLGHRRGAAAVRGAATTVCG